jgi:CubicO group peptidase (beta-lactamase class C family)
MVLRGGVADGRRYISEASIARMTTKQTAPEVPTEYGLGWSAENGTYGHGGALKTNMNVNPQLGLITVFLPQHGNDWRDAEGEKILPAFRAAAEKLLG